MSNRYEPLSGQPVGNPDNGFSMGAANEDDDNELSSLLQGGEDATFVEKTDPIPGDFERADYDVPPPGSPPAHSAATVFGNTNGNPGAEPARPSDVRPSFLRRAVGALLPNHYVRVAVDSNSGPAVGGGMANDGVFGNMAVRPQKNVAVRGEDGNVYMVPEEAQNELPPSYAVAQLDRAPEYGLDIVPGADPNAELLFDNLPAGSFIMFLCTGGISFLFQIVGFIMTYLMHTTHAAKFGSRFGLGLTLIQFGLYSSMGDDAPPVDDVIFYGNGTVAFSDGVNGTFADGMDSDVIQQHLAANYATAMATGQFMAFMIMIFGWFLVVTSLVGFWKVKLWERTIKHAATQPPPTPEEVERNRVVWNTLLNSIGMHAEPDRDPEAVAPRQHSSDPVRPQSEEESTPEELARAHRQLREAGLI